MISSVAKLLKHGPRAVQYKLLLIFTLRRLLISKFKRLTDTPSLGASNFSLGRTHATTSGYADQGGSKYAGGLNRPLQFITAAQAGCSCSIHTSTPFTGKSAAPFDIRLHI